MKYLRETITAIAGRWATRFSRELTRRELLLKNDRILADIGLSRESLEYGVGAWPWRISDSDSAGQPNPSATDSAATAAQQCDRFLRDRLQAA